MIPENYGHLIVGKSYVVTQEFTDYDGLRHSPGETWTYLGYDSFFYDAGLTLYISPGDSIRLQDADLFQRHIVSRLETYIG
ncbi:DUF3601 domain-containing protein [Phyllobacterium sp. SB3]|uniref:DUF3601 domain-containing protein n=1 Tax=Phyllobacterium sp. SB3 TaxID=3156073 RepID=UPI0032AE92FA